MFDTKIIVQGGAGAAEFVSDEMTTEPKVDFKEYFVPKLNNRKK